MNAIKNGINPFDFKNIKPFDKSFADLPGPMLVFSTPGMLHSGTSLELFKKWCSDPRNMLIIPGYCVAGTVGAKVLAGQKSIEVQEVRVRGTKMTTTTVNLPINIQVKNLSFSAHVDAKGILQLASQCRPKNVVLVHGEGSKMHLLRDRIVSTFNCPVYFPANGEVLFIETLPGAAKSIEISRNLYEKRRKDIAEGALQVYRNDAISDTEKLELLVSSVRFQNNKEKLMQVDDFESAVLINDPVSFRPLLLAQWESDPRSMSYKTVLSNYVKRFFLKEKLEKNCFSRIEDQKLAESSDAYDSIKLFHLFLLRNFHPQVCIRLGDSCISIHSIQIDPSGTCVPLLVFEGIHPITPDHLQYTIKWSEAGENLAKVVIKLIQDQLE